MTESDYEIDAKMELEMHTEISNIQAVPLELAQRGSIGVGPEIEVGMEIGPGGLSSPPFLSSSTCSSAESFCEDPHFMMCSYSGSFSFHGSSDISFKSFHDFDDQSEFDNSDVYVM